jgi:hypothetical protein
MSKQSSTRRQAQLERQRILRLVREFRLHPSDNQRVILNFFIALDTPLSLSCYLLYKYKEYDQLVSKEIHPSSYSDGLKFRDDFAAVSFLRKHETLKTTFNKKERALQTFAEGEELCKDTNIRTRRYLLGNQEQLPNEMYLNGAIRKIDRILGSFDIDGVLDMSGWGPGTTISVKGSDTSGSQKFDIDSDFTKDAYYLFGGVMVDAYPLWENIKTPSYLPGNKISTVPKNAKTDRTIAVEPGGNSWVQSGIGRLIRERLRFSGYNLNSDLKNQRGAYIGSIDDSLATIDFKAASDTISIEVVRLLLPPTWFTVLDAARSKHYTLNGVTQRSEKFSTMGNGYTFELESLIFLSLGLAICEAKGLDDSGVSIFGDDLVLPSECVAELTSLCKFLGFTINEQKSFSSGPFRESCGTYYFDGLDVKPLYFKTDLLYVKDLYRMANAIRSLSHSFAFGDGCDYRFRSIWSLLVHLLPNDLRLFGPVSSGDATIHNNLVDSSPTANSDGWCGFNYTGLPESSITIEKESFGLLLSKLNRRTRNKGIIHGVTREFCKERRSTTWLTPLDPLVSGNRVSLREKSRILYKTKMFAYQWYDFGTWVNPPAEVRSLVNAAR